MSEPQLGSYNTLRIIENHESGLLLDGKDSFGSILLPKRYVKEEFRLGDQVKIFLYLDSEDRPIATTECPYAVVGDFAFLEVVDSTRAGSFLDWGLPKDLLLPFGEQPKRLRVGQSTVVYIYVDEVSSRIVASAKLKKHVSDTASAGLRGGNQVSIMLVEKTDIGIRSIVNDRFWGMIKNSDVKSLPPIGSRVQGFVSRVRSDGLIDLSLEPPGYSKVPSAAEKLYAHLKSTDEGFLPVHDKSSPDEIKSLLGMSKKLFKQAVGGLYRDKKINIKNNGIYLCD
ncbi:MAG: S1 RNA-binding domain-containing protein [Verrucomicrobiales bacterium]